MREPCISRRLTFSAMHSQPCRPLAHRNGLELSVVPGAARPGGGSFRAFWNGLSYRSRLLIIIVALCGACALAPNQPVYFVFELRAGETNGALKNIRYSFGSELKDRVPPAARPGLPFQNFSGNMVIPERFEVS